MSRLRSEANRVLRYALGDTFQVVVGKVPSQKHFTLYTSIMSQHPEFFRAASADPTKPVELDDHDPEIFKAYLCCLLGGVHAMLKTRSQTSSKKSSKTRVPPKPRMLPLSIHGRSATKNRSCPRTRSHGPRKAASDVVPRGKKSQPPTRTPAPIICSA
jgi:hypothetical protein